MSLLFRRIKQELLEIQKNPCENCSAGPASDDNLTEWDGFILGPTDTPYEGGLFNIKIIFPEDFPISPPKVQFITKIYHPNIDGWGNICLDLLKDQWSPALSINKLLLCICSLLADPNPDDPLVPSIAYLFKNNIDVFNTKAREYTMQYAR